MGLDGLEKKIQAKKTECTGIITEAEASGLTLPLERLCRECQLSELERDAVIFLFSQQFQNGVRVADTSGKEVLIGILPSAVDMMLNRQLLGQDSKLLKTGIVKVIPSAQDDAMDAFLLGGLFLNESVVAFLLGEVEDWREGARRRPASGPQVIDLPVKS